jgi:cyclopropane fatty-acyl-phospholipid synthase-like methyltransferase
VDGAYVDRTLLEIPSERFQPADLRQPIRVGRQFDLVVSLEVAEHLPAECAAAFVQSLTALGSTEGPARFLLWPTLRSDTDVGGEVMNASRPAARKSRRGRF